MNKPKNIKNAVLTYLLVVSTITQAACAQPGGGGLSERRGPPPEAYEACAELAAGDSCELTGRRGETLQGSCVVPREDDATLVCAPEGGPGGERETGRSSR